MKRCKGLLRCLAGLAMAAAITLTPAAAFAAGPGQGRGGGGGGGGGETTATNNLSVPAVFIGAAGFGLTNTALQAPSSSPAYVTTPNALGSGWYYLQGASKWQAEYMVQGSDTATAKWGDNLAGGSASLRVGHPIRVEMGLTSTHVITLLGYTVIKLDTNLADNVSPYGTPATGMPETGFSATAKAMPARVWGPGATLNISGPASLSGIAMPGEINATGAIVFGYNWRPTAAGSYTLTFNPPAGVTVTDQASLSITVTVTSGGGGGGRGNH